MGARFIVQFILMIGPPGAGKTLLARALPSILPGMTIDQSLVVTHIYSGADQLPPEVPLLRSRPFRAPHHTISYAGLVGGGNWTHPGEISLSHRRVLFLDEFPKFGQRVLEVLRQPLEDKVVTISQAQESLTFPANFQLVAAMNPCPCWYFNEPIKPCTCSNTTGTKYQKRISEPLLGRIDIHVHVPRVDYEKLSGDRLGEPSRVLRNRIDAARRLQHERFSGTRLACNAEMHPADVRKYCALDDAGRSLMKSAMNQMQLSAHTYHRILKLTRTIADLAGAQLIAPSHHAEALRYRPKLYE